MKELGERRERAQQRHGRSLARRRRRGQFRRRELSQLQERFLEGDEDRLNLCIEGVRFELVAVAARDRMEDGEQSTHLGVVARRRARRSAQLADKLAEQRRPALGKVFRSDTAHGRRELRLQLGRDHEEEAEKPVLALRLRRFRDRIRRLVLGRPVGLDEVFEEDGSRLPDGEVDGLLREELEHREHALGPDLGGCELGLGCDAQGQSERRTRRLSVTLGREASRDKARFVVAPARRAARSGCNVV